MVGVSRLSHRRSRSIKRAAVREACNRRAPSLIASAWAHARSSMCRSRWTFSCGLRRWRPLLALVTPNAGTKQRQLEAIYAHLRLDGVSEGIAVGVLADEARVDDVRGLCGESRDAARRADRCSLDVGVVALAHARHHPREKPGQQRSAWKARDCPTSPGQGFIAERSSVHFVENSTASARISSATLSASGGGGLSDRGCSRDHASIRAIRAAASRAVSDFEATKSRHGISRFWSPLQLPQARTRLPRWFPPAASA